MYVFIASTGLYISYHNIITSIRLYILYNRAVQEQLDIVYHWIVYYTTGVYILCSCTYYTTGLYNRTMHLQITPHYCKYYTNRTVHIIPQECTYNRSVRIIQQEFIHYTNNRTIHIIPHIVSIGLCVLYHRSVHITLYTTGLSIHIIPIVQQDYTCTYHASGLYWNS